VKKKEKRRGKASQTHERRSNIAWKIGAMAGGLFFLLVLGKNLFAPGTGPQPGHVSPSSQSGTDPILETKVALVTAEFRCACGKCGGPPLSECSCGQPKGAREEKAFIRKKLLEGLSVEEVIQLMERTYGHRM
jgi:cytochrome c-type biogenesis protein CcmH/NrfF